MELKTNLPTQCFRKKARNELNQKLPEDLKLHQKYTKKLIRILVEYNFKIETSNNGIAKRAAGTNSIKSSKNCCKC